jgi:hypothetical protein
MVFSLLPNFCKIQKAILSLHSWMFSKIPSFHMENLQWNNTLKYGMWQLRIMQLNKLPDTRIFWERCHVSPLPLKVTSHSLRIQFFWDMTVSLDTWIPTFQCNVVSSSIRIETYILQGLKYTLLKGWNVGYILTPDDKDIMLFWNTGI